MIRRAREVARCAVRLGTAVALVSTMMAAAPARADIGLRKTSVPPTVCPSSALIGRAVTDPDDRRVGTVASLLFDKDTGRMRYIVLSPSRGLRLGDDWLALSWDVLRHPMPCHTETIGTAARFDQLAKARPFGIEEVLVNAGTEPASSIFTLKADMLRGPTDDVTKADSHSLLEINDEQLGNVVVDDPFGRAVAWVRRVMVDPRQGRIAYLIVLPLDGLTTNIGFMPMPYEGVHWSASNGAFRIELSRPLDADPRFRTLAYSRGGPVDPALLRSLAKAYRGSAGRTQQVVEGSARCTS